MTRLLTMRRDAECDGWDGAKRVHGSLCFWTLAGR